jgi:hypothetical protein
MLRPKAPTAHRPGPCPRVSRSRISVAYAAQAAVSRCVAELTRS